MTKVLQTETGRSPERPVPFPDVLLYRGRAGDGADCLATIDRRTVVLSRAVSGISCRIRIGLAQFKALALVSRDDAHVVRLLHDDPGLTIDLTEIGVFDIADEYCDRLAEFLDLPRLTMAGRKASGETVVTGPTGPSGRRPVRSNRPRFLARRKTGEVIQFRRVAGEEIIARS